MASKKPVIKRGRPKGSVNFTQNKPKKIIKKRILDFDKHDPIVVEVVSEIPKIAEEEEKQPPQRDARGFFLPGNKIGAMTKNPYKRILENIMAKDFEIITDVVVVKAKSGDVEAIKLLFKYLLPAAPDPEAIKGLKTKSAVELNESMDVVIEHMAEGEISAEGALNYLKALEQKRSFLQSAFLEEKIKEIENRVNGMNKK